MKLYSRAQLARETGWSISGIIKVVKRMNLATIELDRGQQSPGVVLDNAAAKQVLEYCKTHGRKMA